MPRKSSIFFEATISRTAETEVNKLDFEAVMKELESLGKERTKKIYMSNGAVEPLFGVNTGDMKPLLKKTGLDQDLAEKLYATGNYDAMYFAGVIAEPRKMTASDFERWIDGAYFYMISDFVVAVTLSESDIAQEVSDRWINSGEDLKMSAGYSCYCWLLGNRKDQEFDPEKISKMMEHVKSAITDAPVNTKKAMNSFIYTVGISYIPRNREALDIAEEIGKIEYRNHKNKVIVLNPHETIIKEHDKGRLGFKRKFVRC